VSLHRVRERSAACGRPLTLRGIPRQQEIQTAGFQVDARDPDAHAVGEAERLAGAVADQLVPHASNWK